MLKSSQSSTKERHNNMENESWLWQSLKNHCCSPFINDKHKNNE